MHRLISDAEAILEAEKNGHAAPIALTLDDGIRLIEEWRDEYLLRAAGVLTSWKGLAGDYLAVGDTPEQDRTILDAAPLLMVRLYYSDQPVPLDVLSRTLDRILTTAGRILPNPHPLRNALTGSLRNAIATIRAREAEWQSGDWNNRPSKPVRPLATQPVDLGASQPAPRTIKLSDLFDVYVKYAKPKSVSEQKLALRQLCSFLGVDDPLIHEITFEQAERFYQVVGWLPKSMTAALAARPVADLALEMQSGSLKLPRTASSTAAKKLQLLNAMFVYGAARGLLPAGNPFARVVGRKDSKPETKRRPWRPQDVETIFSAHFSRAARAIRGGGDREVYW